MFYKKKDLPNINDFVICTVKDILHHSVFVRLDEYSNLEGLVHISEIAPGRIRNIRDYVKPDKTIVCKVLKVNKENRQIDLSLRRVSINSMKLTLDENRQEEKAEKLLEFVGKQLKLDLNKMYEEVGIKIIDSFGSLREGFNKISFGENDLLKKTGVNETIANLLSKLIKEKIKPIKIKVKLVLELRNYDYNGIELIKKLLEKAYEDYIKKGFEITFTYLSAPKYLLELVTTDKKNSDNLIETIASEIIEKGKSVNIVGKWAKES